ncbi:ligand-binding sensor domain-containing diguanylate cyclase [Mesoterricola silvestris]|uniref:diguanylate cyclase n=1 Tax=Mesoterricola silvestris TaxID=2927979 RepID=A0AA48GND7_9BACT|nr:ligand-binding sensor domain-containing diguanylate cyclase [Mesoterricola silvestris]BDU72715.1 GGDEF domain-containing protein [Mesoterricola silvestris]
MAWALSPLAVLGGAGPPRVPVARIPFQSYGSAQGLENLSLWCLDQDSDGFLWVGTEDGLYRYDGQRFQVLRRSSGLPDDWVRALCASRGRRLWIGTARGLALRDPGGMRALGPDQGVPQAEVFALAPDPQGLLWVATERGLFRQRPGALAFEPAPGWVPGQPARCIAMAGKATYVGTGTRLLRYEAGNRGPVEVAGPWKERLDAVLQDREGRLWVRSRAGLWMRPVEGAPFQDLSRRVGTAAYDGSLTLTATGALLIPTVDDLVRVRGEAWEYLGQVQGLPTPYVNRALEDREGCLWVGGLGLHRALSRETWGQYTYQNGIAGGVVWSITRDREGRLWAGTSNGLCETRNGQWSLVPGTAKQAFLALAVAPDGALWMGGAPARLRRWVPGTSRWQEWARPTSTIISMAFDEQGTLWVVTRREGLFRVVKSGGSFAVEPFVLPGAVQGERVIALSQGQGGRLWLASSNGILVLERGAWRRLGKAQGLLDPDVRAVFERPGGDIWVSYHERQGLSQFRREGDQLRLVQHHDAASGITARKAYFMREDTLGRLWVGTSQGCVLFDGARFQEFGTMDGLPGDECNGSAFLAEPGGDVWVGTLGGLARFHQGRYAGSPPPPASFILSASFGSTVLSFPFTGTVGIPKRDATVEFQFTGLTYLNEARVLNQIRLVGMEDAWRTTNIREVRYQNLAPGTYRFEVRAGLSEGKWGPTAAFPFRVLPAWYQTWWFRCLAGAGLAGLTYLAVRLRLKALNDRNRELERVVETRTLALARANESLQQLTVTDPLTGLKNRRFLDLTLEEDLASARRDHRSTPGEAPLTLKGNVDMVFLMVDLDHFKDVNDTYGHAAGDKVLQQVRDRLHEVARTSDTVVRWGGEEFLVVARRMDRSQGATLAARILESMRSRPFDLGSGLHITKTCSVGFCPYPLVPVRAGDVPWTSVVDVADRCLYAAKQSGRDAWVGLGGQCASAEAVEDFLKAPGDAEGLGLRASVQGTEALRWT